MPSGSQIWYAPPVDATSATLTGEFDLSGLNQATLNFSTWFDLEEDYDFAYVSISTDGGQSWDLLRPEPSIPGDYGPAFTGDSDDYDWPGIGWKDISIPLNNYVGRPVLIRFEVLTDAAVLESGFAIDDLAIPELGYASDVEGDATGWVAAGFVQTGRWLPQQWSVQLVQPGLTPQVMPLTLDDFNQGRWTFELDSQGAVLVIMPQTPFVSEPADYWLHVE
jgi:bacillopeptidase F (M6 metalloprotease family)